MMISFGGFGIAAAPFGVLADRIGLRPTFAIMGGLVITTMVGFLALWSRLPDSPPEDIAEPPPLAPADSVAPVVRPLD